MTTYNEVLNQVQSLTLTDKLRLLYELNALVSQPVKVEGDEEIISPEEIAQSEVAWQDYLRGRDLGVSSKELKKKLF